MSNEWMQRLDRLLVGGGGSPFNGHPNDWARVYAFIGAIWARREGFDMHAAALRAEELLGPEKGGEVWRAIETGIELLDYLEEHGRIQRAEGV